MIEMTLEGGKQLEHKMLMLERVMARKINRKAVRAGIKVILGQAKANAQSMLKSKRGGDMGKTIARSLQIVVGTYYGKRRRGQYYMKVQHNPKYNDRFVDKGNKSPLYQLLVFKRSGKISPKQNYIPTAIEYGHITRDGRGFVREIPYLRTAFDSKARSAAAILRRELFSGIEREWRVG